MLLLLLLFTKVSEASWSYSCDSKVSFDRVQILIPDFLGRRYPSPFSPLPSSPFSTLLLLSSSLSSSYLFSLPPSFLPLRKFDSVLSSLFGMRLALRILRSYLLTLTVLLCVFFSRFFFFVVIDSHIVKGKAGLLLPTYLLDDEDVVASYPLDAPPFGRSLAISPSCPQVGDPWVLKRLTSGAKGC